MWDAISACTAWTLFFIYRKNVVEAAKHGYEIPINGDVNLWVGMLVLGIIWLSLYYTSGFYFNLFRRSRLREVSSTFNISMVGSLIVFFALILDDSVKNYTDYYKSLITYFTLHFVLTVIGRLIISTRTIHKIQNRSWGYNTLLVGSGNKMQELVAELNNAKVSEGFYIRGFVSENGGQLNEISGIKHLGNWKEIPQLVQKNKIEDVIICLDDKDHELVPKIVDLIQNEEVHLKIMPDSYGLVMGMVKMNNILGAMLVEVDFEVMPQWQKTVKRIFDIVFSCLALILCFPFFIMIAIMIKLDSKGPVFYRQERIGYKGRPFKIIKFRSMKVDAEQSGPQLSNKNDDRRTKSGIFLRKSRLDELPQFYNVLIGEMSVVGPRPEREYFKERIMEKAPVYSRLHRVKPGITSWGQIKFGYAETIDQMVDRMKYDLLYLENMSLGLDLKIMIYTVLIMIQGRGK